MKTSVLWTVIAAGMLVAAIGEGRPQMTEPMTPSEPVPLKDFDCGGKGQKACPMQAWMKSTMNAAAGSGDGAKLADALSYVAAHAPPGMGEWAAIANAGAAKAKANDVPGAKESCKKCHALYKNKYKEEMRDRPF